MIFPQVRESLANLMAFAELGTAESLSWILAQAESLFDWIAVDCDQKLPESAAIVETARSRVPPRACCSTATIRSGSIPRSTWCSVSKAA